MICFFRQILDIDKLDSKYREIESQELLEEIKNLLHQSITPSDIYTYQVNKKYSLILIEKNLEVFLFI
jgi:hypothetical protein